MPCLEIFDMPLSTPNTIVLSSSNSTTTTEISPIYRQWANVKELWHVHVDAYLYGVENLTLIFSITFSDYHLPRLSKCIRKSQVI